MDNTDDVLDFEEDLSDASFEVGGEDDNNDNATKEGEKDLEEEIDRMNYDDDNLLKIDESFPELESAAEVQEERVLNEKSHNATNNETLTKDEPPSLIETKKVQYNKNRKKSFKNTRNSNKPRNQGNWRNFSNPQRNEQQWQSSRLPSLLNDMVGAPQLNMFGNTSNMQNSGNFQSRQWSPNLFEFTTNLIDRAAKVLLGSSQNSQHPKPTSLLSIGFSNTQFPSMCNTPNNALLNGMVATSNNYSHNQNYRNNNNNNNNSSSSNMNNNSDLIMREGNYSFNFLRARSQFDGIDMSSAINSGLPSGAFNNSNSTFNSARNNSFINNSLDNSQMNSIGSGINNQYRPREMPSLINNANYQNNYGSPSCRIIPLNRSTPTNNYNSQVPTPNICNKNAITSGHESTPSNYFGKRGVKSWSSNFSSNNNATTSNRKYNYDSNCNSDRRNSSNNFNYNNNNNKNNNNNNNNNSFRNTKKISSENIQNYGNSNRNSYVCDENVDTPVFNRTDCSTREYRMEYKETQEVPDQGMSERDIMQAKKEARLKRFCETTTKSYEDEPSPKKAVEWEVSKAPEVPVVEVNEEYLLKIEEQKRKREQILRQKGRTNLSVTDGNSSTSFDNSADMKPFWRINKEKLKNMTNPFEEKEAVKIKVEEVDLTGEQETVKTVSVPKVDPSKLARPVGPQTPPLPDPPTTPRVGPRIARTLSEVDIVCNLNKRNSRDTCTEASRSKGKQNQMQLPRVTRTIVNEHAVSRSVKTRDDRIALAARQKHFFLPTRPDNIAESTGSLVQVNHLPPEWDFNDVVKMCYGFGPLLKITCSFPVPGSAEIQFKAPTAALDFQKKYNGRRTDNQHTLKVTLL